MLFRRLVCAACAGASLFVGVTRVVGAQGPQPAPQTALAQIERGQWLLKEKLGSERKICFTAPVSFIQLAHGPAPCEQFVISQDQRSATVRYSCTGHGQGRTTVTVETPRLVRIDTQGVLDGAPFDQEYEARRIGSCS